MTKDQARTGLLAFNLAVGAVFLLFPKTTIRLYGLDPAENAAVAFPVRYLGARSLVFAAMLASDQGREALLKQLPVLAVADAAASGLAAVTGEVPRRVSVLAALTSAAGVALGTMSREE